MFNCVEEIICNSMCLSQKKVTSDDEIRIFSNWFVTRDVQI
jgi:hypothetical protein